MRSLQLRLSGKQKVSAIHKKGEVRGQMKTQFTEQSERKLLSEFDPAPRYIVATLRSNWVRGSIRRRWRLVKETAIIYVAPSELP